MSKKALKSKPEAKPKKQIEKPNIYDVMATDSYYKVTLKESAIPGNKFGDLYVGINEYTVFLPRLKPILISETIFTMLNSLGGAAANPKDARDDIQMIPQFPPLTAMEAHECRLAGEQVFPFKCPSPMEAQAKIDAYKEQQETE